jgi:alpha-L-fucosidase 2
VAEAVAFVRCHAGALSADPDRIVLLGEDVGADLAALVTRRRPAGLAATVLVGGRYDPQTLQTGDAARASDPGAAPVARRGGPAPVLAIHGGNDTEVPVSQAAAYCEAVRREGGTCERLVVGNASHRPENWWPRHWGYKRRLVEWLNGQVGEPAPHVPQRTRLQKRLVYDAEERLTLDLWTPAGTGPFPLVMLVHGGGWEAGDRVTYITPLFEPMARAGFAWCSIDYRLTPQVQHPAQLRDLRTAIAFVRANTGRWNLDPDRIALVGESASAQMVMQAASTEARLAGVVSFYGVYDFEPMVTDASPRSLLARLFGRGALDDDARAVLRRYSPTNHVHAGMPPVLLVHGTNERLWDQGLAMARALEWAGVRHELVRLDGAPHGMENWEGMPAWAHYKTRVVSWLLERFGSGPVASGPKTKD